MKEFNSQYFKNLSEDYSRDIDSAEKKSVALSFVRLFLFVLAVVFVVIAFVKHALVLFLSLAGVLLAAFIVVCIIHQKVKDSNEYLKALRYASDGYAYRISRDFISLEESVKERLADRNPPVNINKNVFGEKYIKKDHEYCFDLDLFGARSIFALYNVSETSFGRDAFADELLRAPKKGRSIEELKARQAACRKIASDPVKLVEYQARAMSGHLEDYPDALIKFAKNAKTVGQIPQIISKILPFLWLIPIATVFTFNPLFIRAALTLVLFVNLIFWIIGLLKNSSCFGGIERQKRQISAYISLLGKIEENYGDDGYINSLVNPGENRSKDVLSGLMSVMNLLDLRSQPILALVFNLIFPLDWYGAAALGKWAKTYGGDFEEVLEGIGCCEALMSAANGAYLTEVNSFPEFVDSEDPSDNAFFDGVKVCHPLLMPETAVSNSVSLDSTTAIITGSNMSGKTTLIRTCGVCSLLSYIGGYVPCESLKIGRMNIVSSMRIVDSLEDNMSTFKSELVRISKIIEASKEGRPMLFLIDEIFRGTNSDDRTQGALTVLRSLSKPYICGFMTTHDYALVDKTVESMDNIAYYHFSDRYTDDSIVFDYILTEGISRESNAAFLMKLVGIE